MAVKKDKKVRKEGIQKEKNVKEKVNKILEEVCVVLDYSADEAAIKKNPIKVEKTDTFLRVGRDVMTIVTNVSGQVFVKIICGMTHISNVSHRHIDINCIKDVYIREDKRDLVQKKGVRNRNKNEEIQTISIYVGTDKEVKEAFILQGSQITDVCVLEAIQDI